MPSVYPFSVPDMIVTMSFSARGVVSRLCPGRRRVSCGWMSASVSAIRDGTPSTIAPTPLQCDSPKVVTRKIWPKVLIVPVSGCWR